MPKKVKQNTAAESWANELVDAYTTPQGKAAEALDKLIDKLEKKSAELNRKMDQEQILLRNSIDGELKTCKILRDRCIDAAKKRSAKDVKEKKALKDASLAAGYHLASVKMFHELADNDLMAQITGVSHPEQFSTEMRDVFSGYVNDMREIMQEKLKNFKESAKEEGIEVKDENAKTNLGDFEIWDFMEEKKPKKEADPDADDLFAEEYVPRRFRAAEPPKDPTL